MKIRFLLVCLFGVAIFANVRATTSSAPAGPADGAAPVAPVRRSIDVTWNEASHCAMARVMRQHVRYQKNFSLTEYPSRTAAEKAAAAWVRAQIARLPPETPRKGRVTASNRSGVVGVWLVPVRLTKPDGRRYEYWRWTANWPHCPHHGGVSWYVHQYGDDDAFVLAVLSRRLETVDRAKVLAEFDRIDGTAEHEATVALQRIDAPATAAARPATGRAADSAP